MVVIRGLTVRQPMAWAIVAGHKPVENRSWAPWDGVTHLAIHAGQGTDPNLRRMVEENLGRPVPDEDLVHGAILGVARLRGFTRVNQILLDAPAQRWASGPFVWLLEDVQPLDEPIPRSGALGLWKISPEHLAELHRQLPELLVGRGEDEIAFCGVCGREVLLVDALECEECGGYMHAVCAGSDPEICDDCEHGETAL